ncbi:hypothetical protein GT347_18365 [Xylophilus rhododendri]|uniref:Lipoprotein n=1 Tax=Xylophilus rhododendri TaxID=2697032 RepID=A0A857J6Y1_9BURK|nr:hypothetical protein [Xylophilus rhododendri]QHI99770.1 hypothetical protein GT347_18365 [Xylophilus rhododendri]
MRIAFSALILLLLALTALAGSGCKRPVANASVHAFSRVGHLVPAHPLLVAQQRQQAEPSHPMFVFCHPRADLLDDASLSAAAAQVVFDLQANNDDRTEMIAADFTRPEVDALPQAQASSPHPASATAWPRRLLRPPRTALLLA